MLKRIIIHWTAGSWFPTNYEKQFYHFLVDKNGITIPGKFPPEANLVCVNNKYAPHTGGGNTNSIGVALCAMAGFKNSKNLGMFPITSPQLESALCLCALLSKKYKIPISKSNIFTHYEFGLLHPFSSSKGKIDIIFLPPFPKLKPLEIGDFLRQKILWYRHKPIDNIKK